jgi:uncharacterized protein YjbJ (UPF0337 family)
MSTANKAKNVGEKTRGEVKKHAGKATGNRSLEAAGKRGEVKSNLKAAGEKIKDAGKKIKKAGKK